MSPFQLSTSQKKNFTILSTDPGFQQVPTHEIEKEKRPASNYPDVKVLKLQSRNLLLIQVTLH